LPNDPDLARIAAAWATLPEVIKRAMLALVDSAKPGEGEVRRTS
jgi:hypothetical protein